PYDAVILISQQAVQRPGIAHALAPLIGAIDETMMREANRQVDMDGQTPAQAAAWLDSVIAE
ncbi:MAG: ABC transporter permease, partial [Maricaulis sp.]|nr:ABC transporter permease [Maricaulis sp.]